ncbi:hypothetical protein ZOSMA_56G00950 [Zostera marina]|uniref:Uncharacterized protein n=1 Tax=Zostera marina TaxID=29655 RepID=A0A0K9NVS6_ZOSMR|nr:hypothetical protein ZOSMA_56G00950 [Zostera marina]
MEKLGKMGKRAELWPDKPKKENKKENNKNNNNVKTKKSNDKDKKEEKIDITGEVTAKNEERGNGENKQNKKGKNKGSPQKPRTDEGGVPMNMKQHNQEAHCQFPMYAVSYNATHPTTTNNGYYYQYHHPTEPSPFTGDTSSQPFTGYYCVFSEENPNTCTIV